jgi:hypothetical protein
MREAGSFACDLAEIGTPLAFDDAMRRYLAEARPAFDELRDVTSQLAGLMVLAASGAGVATTDHPMWAVATERGWAACEVVRSLRVPPPARHHHRHMVWAAEALGGTIATMREAGTRAGRLNAPLGLLKTAWQEIVHAADALPGFGTIDMQQTCCAAHAKLRITLDAS